MDRAQELITHLGLQPHPEGGHYGEVYRSASTVQPADARGARRALTTIYFLLREGERSRLHVVASDEVWHFYEGAPLELVWADRAFSSVERRLLGPVGAGTQPVATVPADHWQGARSTGAYTLVGCTVAPGFEFADFTLIDPASADAATVRSARLDLIPFL